MQMEEIGGHQVVGKEIGLFGMLCEGRHIQHSMISQWHGCVYKKFKKSFQF